MAHTKHPEEPNLFHCEHIHLFAICLCVHPRTAIGVDAAHLAELLLGAGLRGEVEGLFAFAILKQCAMNGIAAAHGASRIPSLHTSGLFTPTTPLHRFPPVLT